MTTHYSCLFTKHKTQKRKTWHDGKLTVQTSGRVTLEKISSQIVNSDVNGSLLDAIDIQLSAVGAIKNGNLSELEFEMHLVTIEGPYHPPTETPSHPIASKVGREGPNILQSRQNPSNGMKKLMSKKFQVPSKIIPSHPSQKENNRNIASRKRPLQPGELVRKHYMQPSVGLQSKDSVSAMGDSMPSQYSGMNLSRPPYQNSSWQQSQKHAMTSNLQSHNQFVNPTQRKMNSSEPQAYSEVPRNPPFPSNPSITPVAEQHSQNIAMNVNAMMSSEKRLKGNIGPTSASSNSKSQHLESNEFNPSAFYGKCFDESEASQSDEEENGQFQELCNDGRSERNEMKFSNEKRESSGVDIKMRRSYGDNDGVGNEVLSKSELLSLFSGKTEEEEKSSRTNEKAKSDATGKNDMNNLQRTNSQIRERMNAEEDEPNPLLATLLQSEAELEDAMKRNENIENVTWKNINDDQSVYTSDNEETSFFDEGEDNEDSNNCLDTNVGGKEKVNVDENHNEVRIDPASERKPDNEKKSLDDQPSKQLENSTNDDAPMIFTLNVGDGSSSDESYEDK